jgi:hypothetical protein
VSIVAVLLGIFVGVVIFRDQAMRSLRTVVLVAICSLAGFVVLERVPSWTPPDPAELLVTTIGASLGLIIVVIPIIVSSVWRGRFTALPPADYREHQLIEGVRHDLVRDSSATSLKKARAALTAAPPTADEWRSVRDALLAQIAQSESLQSGESIRPKEVIEARRRTVGEWTAAIRRRRRFLR